MSVSTSASLESFESEGVRVGSSLPPAPCLEFISPGPTRTTPLPSLGLSELAFKLRRMGASTSFPHPPHGTFSQYLHSPFPVPSAAAVTHCRSRQSQLKLRHCRSEIRFNLRLPFLLHWYKLFMLRRPLFVYERSLAFDRLFPAGQHLCD